MGVAKEIATRINALKYEDYLDLIYPDQVFALSASN